MLQENGNGYTVLMGASYRGKTDVVLKLIEADVDLEAADNVGCCFPVLATLDLYGAACAAHSLVVGGGCLMRAWLYAAGWQDGSDDCVEIRARRRGCEDA